jgi:Cdc6-like AAA superfamily ATPase
MSKFIKNIIATGVHGRIDLQCQFQEGVNIIYGKNGTGKTTLLHMMANLLNADYERFMALNFKTVKVELSDGEVIIIELEKIPKKDHYHGYIFVNGKKINEEEFCPKRLARKLEEREARFFREDESRQPSLFPEFTLKHLKEPALSIAYFPAFRTVIDAWAINQDESPIRTSSSRRRIKQQIEKTEFARGLFGLFVPRLDYPATSEIEWQLNEQTSRKRVVCLASSFSGRG